MRKRTTRLGGLVTAATRPIILHCLDPPLTVPPPGKFFCDLCVECQFCGRHTSSDPRKPTYSTRRDACSDCMKSQKQGSVQYYQRMPLHGNCGARGDCLCGVEKVVPGLLRGRDPVACGFCGQGYHGECAEQYLGYLEEGSPPACPRCRSDPANGLFESHLGEGGSPTPPPAKCQMSRNKEN